MHYRVLLTYTILFFTLSCAKQEPIEEELPLGIAGFNYLERPGDGEENVDPYTVLKVKRDEYFFIPSPTKVYVSVYIDNMETLYGSWFFPDYVNELSLNLLQDRTYFLKTFIYEFEYENVVPYYSDSSTYDIISFKTAPIAGVGLESDIEGNEYETIKIGKQTWFKQNLRTSTFANGDDASSYIITEVESNFAGLKTHATFFGYMHEIMLQDNNICPSGWHVPTKEDFDTLLDFAEKEYGYFYTNDLVVDGDNNSLFSFNSEESAYLFSQDYYGTDTIWGLGSYPYNSRNSSRIENQILPCSDDFDKIYRFDNNYAIRCIKDE